MPRWTAGSTRCAAPWPKQPACRPSALADRRERLLRLAQTVRAESQRTASLVRHALEFNQRMIGALLGVAGEGRVYSADGKVRTETNTTIVRHCV